jgi:enoyl-CoA hydratase
MTLVKSEIVDGVAVATLCDPGHRNAITLAMAEEIAATFDELESNGDVGAVVITGQGKAFCAGADLDVLASGQPSAYRAIYQAFMRVARCPLPTIAAVNGAATGAGLNLLLCCDVRITVPRARFIARFLDIGLHPGGGHTWMLTRAVGPERAKAMVLCGDELDGEAAARAGLVLRCVDPAELLESAIALGRSAASIPRPLIERTKATMQAIIELDRYDHAVDVEAAAQAWSATLPYFQERVGALRTQISSAPGSPNDGR